MLRPVSHITSTLPVIASITILCSVVGWISS
jgi:hypothetical protein